MVHFWLISGVIEVVYVHGLESVSFAAVKTINGHMLLSLLVKLFIDN